MWFSEVIILAKALLINYQCGFLYSLGEILPGILLNVNIPVPFGICLQKYFFLESYICDMTSETLNT